jgi:acetyl esterase/lipase
MTTTSSPTIPSRASAARICRSWSVQLSARCMSVEYRQ